MRRLFFVFLITLIFGVTAVPVSADRGHYPFNSNVSVYQDGQKAICAWNGKEEIMILSTDLKANGKTRVLEFLPLPSKPVSVEKSNTAPFEAVQRIIRLHRPPSPANVRVKRSRAPAKEAVSVVFHEKIGAHDITIVKVNELSGFMNWIYKFLQDAAVEYNPAWGKRASPLLEDLLKKGLNYYVFDIIELTPDKQSIEPIKYRFPAESLYFPLRVSSLDSGRVDISLFLFTPEAPDIHGTRTGFDCGHYLLRGADPVPIKFRVNEKELIRVSRDIGELFSQEQGWFSTAVYHGRVDGLTRDFYIK